MSEAKHEASRKCTPSPTSYFYPYSTVWEEKLKWQSSRNNRMLTFKGLPSASPIPRASKLSAKCVVVVTRPRTSKTCLVWENFTICYEYWIWIRPINDGYVTITTRILFTRPKGGLSETLFERKVRVTWRVTHSSTKLPMYFKKLDSKKYKNQVIATFNIHN